MYAFILLIMMILITGEEARVEVAVDSPLLGAVLLIMPYLMIGLVMWLASRVTLMTLREKPERGPSAMARLDRALTMLRWSIAVVFAVDVYALGLTTWLAAHLGHLLVVNDVLALLLPLGTVCVGWWAYYPIDRRLREASLIRDLDSGEPVYAIWTRGQYLVSQVRYQILLILLPFLAISTWIKFVDMVMPSESAYADYAPLFVLAGVAVVFLFTPPIMRHIWDTVAIPEGALRSMLTRLCADEGVRVRELLVWRTYGGMINGAVMGVIAPLRYILLTDALIERLSPLHVQAVMAHEMGHIRRHHMFWMIVCAIGPLSLILALADIVLRSVMTDTDASMLMDSAGLAANSQSTMTLPVVAVLFISVILWAFIFGYISRRFERQADTFAAVYMSTQLPTMNRTPPAITHEAAATVAGALRSVAVLNHIPIGRHEWRHGSIGWRIDYLYSLADRPSRTLPIDAQLRWIRWGCAASFAVAVALGLLPV